MALVELNRFNEITELFSSIKERDVSDLHNQIVSSYIVNGNELQISTFLIVLAKSNVALFNRAIDRVFNLNIYFSGYSIDQVKNLIDELLTKQEFLLVAKLACTFGIKVKNVNNQLLLDSLLHYRQINYAEKLMLLTSYSLQIDIYNHLPNFIKENLSKELLIKFLDLCKRSKTEFNLYRIRLELSLHLNPKTKTLAFEYDKHVPLSQELIYKICLENIRIGNYSSIEFALNLMNKFGLQNKVDINFIIDSLLSNPKFQRLEFAYKLIKEYNLSEVYSYQSLIDLAINANDYQGFNLAKQIIVEEFPKREAEEKLLYLCCVLIISANNIKQAKEIIFREIQYISNEADLKENRSYYGYVNQIRKGIYQIGIGSSGLLFNIHIRDCGRLRINDFIKFEILKKSEKTTDFIIQVIGSSFVGYLFSKYYFGSLFIGQIIEAKVIKLDKFTVFLEHPDIKEVSFIIDCKEAPRTYVGELIKTITLNQVLKVK